MSLSVVVIAFDMGRELPRTILSLSTSMQRGIDRDDYEIIIVDNGSSPPVPQPVFGFPHRLITIDDAPLSPARAVNIGLGEASGQVIGVMIDGARLASPRLLSRARMACKLHARPIVASLGFHLGPTVQMDSITRGYDSAAEDAMLEQAGWTEDGYRLFDVSVFAGSSRSGWFGAMAESNAIFLPRELWTELGGYEERFVSPGGGLVNLDTYTRACALPDTQVIVLLGEGTFHQVHGGIATNAVASPWAAFHAEYEAIRGHAFMTPQVEPLYLGTVNTHTLPSIAASASRGDPT